MVTAIGLLLLGAALVAGGCLVAVNAKAYAASSEREFYGPSGPRPGDRERDAMLLSQLAAPGRLGLLGATLIASGGAILVLAINLAARAR